MADFSFMGVDYSQGSAVDILRGILKPYGLSDLATGMYDVGKNSQHDPNVAYLWLREQPQYKTAFPGMELRAKNGLSPMTEQQYIDWKSAYTSAMKNNGIPPGFYDGPEDFAQFIGNDISPQEVEKRVVDGVVAVQQAPQEVRDALFNYYGVTDGDLAAYWLDPNKKGKDLLFQKAATWAGAQAAATDFGQISRQEAESLAAANVTPEQAKGQFGVLGASKELFGGLTGEAVAPSDQFTREEQIRFAQGDEEAQRELVRLANKRKAVFAGGGSVAAGQEGVSGLGSSSK